MIITITKTLTISPENISLISLIISKLGGLLENETMEEGIVRILGETEKYWTLSNIIPHLDQYFWEQWAAQSQSLKELLNWEAFTISINIE